MRTTCKVIKRLPLLLMILFPSFLSAGEALVGDQAIIARFLKHFQGNDIDPGYMLVAEDGSECCAAKSPEKVYLLDWTSKAKGTLIFSQELNDLIEQNYEFLMLNDSFIKTARGGYFVLYVIRAVEYETYQTGCVMNSAPDKAYLFSVIDSRVKIVSKFFGGCAAEFEVIREGNTVGYRVTERGGRLRSVRYMLRGDVLVREPDYWKKKGVK